MTNLIRVLLISISILSISCSKIGLTDKVARGPTLKIGLWQGDFVSKQSGTELSSYYTKPQIIIEPLTPVTCTNGELEVMHCVLDEDQPLPEKIEVRYGLWVSDEEADKRFPSIPDEAYENGPDDRNFKTLDEYLKADEAFREQIYNQPQYKKTREAERVAMEREIDWHTYTIYPRQMMQKYHDDMSFINRMRASIVYYDITFHYDMSVTEEDSILYLDPALPWWLSK